MKKGDGDGAVAAPFNHGTIPSKSMGWIARNVPRRAVMAPRIARMMRYAIVGGVVEVVFMKVKLVLSWAMKSKKW